MRTWPHSCVSLTASVASNEPDAASFALGASVDEQVAQWPEQSLRAKNGLARSSTAGANLKKLSDAELMHRLRSGEQEALAHLFARYHRLVLNVATRIVRDRGEAEDLMQDVFFEVYRLVDRFDSAKGTAKGWIVQLAYHKSFNRRRYLALRGAFEERRLTEFDPPDAQSFGSPAGLAQDVMPLVEKGLMTLSEKQRQTVEAVCFEGLLLSEVAERTKESLANVRHHYYRGIEKLRSFVKDELADGENRRASLPGGDE
jgi:RNA polymerase sigma-70 factor (ECF subfamily)